jgi:hypothetical protein
MAAKETIIIEAKTAEAQKEVDNLTKSVNKSSKSVNEFDKAAQDATGRLDKATGGLITGFKRLTAGIRTSIASMGVLKTAIIATGVGALVVAFGTLVTFFTKTQRGADAIDRVFAGIGATVDVLIDRISTFGEGLFKILSGDFEDGFNLLKESISGVGEEIGKESKAAVQLEKDMQALEKREIEFIKVQAEKRRAIESARLEAEDESKSDQERAAALKESIRIQNELTDEQIEIEKERARIIKGRVELGESMNDDLRNQAEAEAKVIQLEAERDRRLRSLQTRLNAFTKETKDSTEETDKEAEAKKKLSEEQEKLNKKREEELRLLVERSKTAAAEEQISLLQQAERLENEFLNRSLERQDIEINKVREKYFAIIEAARAAGQDVTNLEAAQQAEISDIENASAQRRIDLKGKEEEAKLNIVGNALSAAAGLAEQGSATYKALAVAQVLLDTFRGVQAAFASNAANVGATTVTGGSWPFIQAAAAAAFGAANIAGILAVDPKSPSPSAASSLPSSTGAAVASASSAPQFNTQAAIQQSRLLSDISGSVSQPTRAFVVAGDVTTAQELSRKRIKNASF